VRRRRWARRDRERHPPHPRVAVHAPRPAGSRTRQHDDAWRSDQAIRLFSIGPQCARGRARTLVESEASWTWHAAETTARRPDPHAHESPSSLLRPAVPLSIARLRLHVRDGRPSSSRMALLGIITPSTSPRADGHRARMPTLSVPSARYPQMTGNRPRQGVDHAADRDGGGLSDLGAPTRKVARSCAPARRRPRGRGRRATIDGPTIVTSPAPASLLPGSDRDATTPVSGARITIRLSARRRRRRTGERLTSSGQADLPVPRRRARPDRV
jgi:hypothetical protein